MGEQVALSVGAARRLLARTFSAADLDTPELDARLLLGHALALDHAGLATAPDRLLSAPERQRLEGLAARRMAREPVCRIVGLKEFWGLPLVVSPAVLSPRPETETVVAAALAAVADAWPRDRKLRIADLGTGSGAILLALLTELSAPLAVGTDCSEAALAVARHNARHLGVADRTHFVGSHYGAALTGPFDLIVCNPPYIASAEIADLAPEVRDYDPRLALDGGPDGLAGYRAVGLDAVRLLAPDGHLVVELGDRQAPAVTQLLEGFGLAAAGPPIKDFSGVARALHMRRP